MSGPVHTIIKIWIALVRPLPTDWLLILTGLRVLLFSTVENCALFLLTMVNQGVDLLNNTA